MHVFESAIQPFNSVIITKIDPKKFVGNMVYAKVMNVAEMEKYYRRYGAISKKNELPGVLVEFIKERTISNRFNIFVVYEYAIVDLPYKRNKINIFSVLR